MSSITGKVNSKGKLVGSVSPSSGVKNYEDLAGLPSINGVQLIGDKTTEDLKLEYVVHVTGDEESGFVADKTNAEISELSKRGFKVTLKVAGRSKIYELILCSISNAVFQSYIPKIMRIDQVLIMLDNVYIEEMDVVPSPTARGGVKADDATENDTIPVNIDNDGFLKTSPRRLVVNLTADTDGSNIIADKTFKEIKAALDSGLDVVCLLQFPDESSSGIGFDHILFNVVGFSSSAIGFVFLYKRQGMDSYEIIISLEVNDDNTWHVQS